MPSAAKFTPLLLVFLFTRVFSQSSVVSATGKSASNSFREKNGEIYTVFDPGSQFNTLNVYPVFAKFSSYLTEFIKPDQNYNYLDDRNIEAAASYVYHPKDEKFLNEFFDFRVSKKVNSFMSMRRPRMSWHDSLIVVDEIRNIERAFKDSAIVSYKASDSLVKALKNYPAENHVFMDVLYFKAKSLSNDEFHHWALAKLFVFDGRTWQLTFYNYYMEYAGKKSGAFGKSDVPKVCFKSLFRKFGEYCDGNKKSHRKKLFGE